MAHGSMRLDHLGKVGVAVYHHRHPSPSPLRLSSPLVCPRCPFASPRHLQGIFAWPLDLLLVNPQLVLRGLSSAFSHDGLQVLSSLGELSLCQFRACSTAGRLEQRSGSMTTTQFPPPACSDILVLVQSANSGLSFTLSLALPGVGGFLSAGTDYHYLLPLKGRRSLPCLRRPLLYRNPFSRDSYTTIQWLGAGR